MDMVEFAVFNNYRCSVDMHIKKLRKSELKLQRKARNTKNEDNREKFRSVRDRLFYERMENRYNSRVLHLAYAFMTGKSYFEVEAKVMRTNMPKHHEDLWLDVANEVWDIMGVDVQGLVDAVLKWRNEHPGYKAMVVLAANPLTGANCVSQLNDICNLFGDYWLYVDIYDVDGPENEEKEAA